MTQSGKPKLSSRAKSLAKSLAEGDEFALAGAVLSGSEDVIDDASLAVSYESRKLLLHDLANLRDKAGLAWFWRRRVGNVLPETSGDMIELRDELRGVWTGRKSPAEEVLNKWLRWYPSRDHAEAYRRFGFSEKVDDYMAFSCSIASRRLVPNFKSLRSMLIQGVLEHWGHFKKCRNPDCLSPYFIAKRKDQTVCDSGACKAEKQREHALKWWRENRSKNSKSRRITKKRAAPKRELRTRH